MRSIRGLILISCFLCGCIIGGCAKSTRKIIGAKVKNENVRVFKNTTSGMQPTISVNQRFAADCSYYEKHVPQRGDVIVFTHPQVNLSVTTVKRIIAIGGDTIELKSGNVLLNGDVLKESYKLKHSNNSIRGDIAPTIIPGGHVFVMGDNRSNSYDSRMWGDKFLPVKNIECKVFK
jgi:signal peptidase I